MNEPILEAKGLSIRFGGVDALNSVSFALARGEVLGLAGDNGAGKSTLIKIASGVYAAQRGEIWFDGRRVALRDPQEVRAQSARKARCQRSNIRAPRDRAARSRLEADHLGSGTRGPIPTVKSHVTI